MNLLNLSAGKLPFFANVSPDPILESPQTILGTGDQRTIESLNQLKGWWDVLKPGQMPVEKATPSAGSE